MQPIYEQMSQEFKLAHHFSAPLSGFQPVSEKTRGQTVYFCSIGAVRVKSKVSNDTNTMWNDCNVTLPSSLTIPVAVWMCVCVCVRQGGNILSCPMVALLFFCQTLVNPRSLFLYRQSNVLKCIWSFERLKEASHTVRVVRDDKKHRLLALSGAFLLIHFALFCVIISQVVITDGNARRVEWSRGENDQWSMSYRTLQNDRVKKHSWVIRRCIITVE